MNSKWLRKVNKQTNTSSGSYYIITNWSLGCSQTNTSEPHTSLKNACWRGRTVGSAGGGGGGEAGGCDQGVIGEGNRQRCQREAAAGEMQTAAGGAKGSEAQPDQNGRQPGVWSIQKAAFWAKQRGEAQRAQMGTLLSSKDSTSTLMTPKCQLKGWQRAKRAVHHDHRHNGRTTDVFPLIGIFLFPVLHRMLSQHWD